MMVVPAAAHIIRIGAVECEARAVYADGRAALVIAVERVDIVEGGQKRRAKVPTGLVDRRQDGW